MNCWNRSEDVIYDSEWDRMYIGCGLVWVGGTLVWGRGGCDVWLVILWGVIIFRCWIGVGSS